MNFFNIIKYSLLPLAVCANSYAVYSYEQLEERILASGNFDTVDNSGWINEESEKDGSGIQTFSQDTVYAQIDGRKNIETGAVIYELQRLSGDFVAQFDLIGHWLDFLFQTTAGYYKKVNTKCSYDAKGNIKKMTSKDIHDYLEKQLETLFSAIGIVFGDLDEQRLLQLGNQWIKCYALLCNTPINTNDMEVYTREQEKRTLSVQVFKGCRLLARLRGYAASLYAGENRLDERFNIVGGFIEPIIYQLFDRCMLPLFGQGGDLFENMKAALWQCLLMPVSDDKANKNLFSALQAAQLWIHQDKNSIDVNDNTIQRLRTFLSHLLDGDDRSIINASSVQVQTFIQGFFEYLNTFDAELLRSIIIEQEPIEFKDLYAGQPLLGVYFIENKSFWRVDSLIVSDFLNLIRKLDSDTQHMLIKGFGLLKHYQLAAGLMARCDLLITRYHAVMNFAAIADYLVEMGYEDQITFCDLLTEARAVRQAFVDLSEINDRHVLKLDAIIEHLERKSGTQTMEWLRANTNQGEVIQDEVYGLPEVPQTSDWIAMDNLRASLRNLFEEPSARVITGGSF